MPRIDAFLKIMQQSGASDLHLGDGYSPFLRMHGILESTQHRVFTPEEVKILFFEMLTDAQIRELEDAGEIDIMYELAEVARFRINIYKALPVLVWVPPRSCGAEFTGPPVGG